jgi:hypothetical protein
MRRRGVGKAGNALTTRELCKGRASHRQETRHEESQKPLPARGQPRLVDQVGAVIRRLRCSVQTEQGYVDRIRRFILLHGKRHPDEREAVHVEALLNPLAVKSNVASSTQNHARTVIVFL